MNPIRSLNNVLALLLAVALVSCASSDRKSDNPYRNRLGVLVVAGDGLNSFMGDAQGDATLLAVSQKFAEALRAEFDRRGAQASVYVNLDRQADTAGYVSRLLADKRRDGLVQVAVRQVTTDKENSIYLTANYNPLRWDGEKAGAVVVATGPAIRHKLLAIGSSQPDERYTPVESFAKAFADTLEQQGYIGK